MAIKIFKGKKKEPEKRNYRWCAFDSETVGFDGDICFGTYALELRCGGMYAGYFETWETFFAHILLNRDVFNDVKFIAHNMGFDLGRATSTIIAYTEMGHRFSVLASGENIIGLTWYDENGEKVAEFNDSFALFPQSLDKFTKKFSPDLCKMTGSVDFTKETPDINNDTHLEYALVDSMSLLTALINFDKLLYKNFRVHAKITTASTAMHAFRVSLPQKNFGIQQLSKEVENYARKAYYGGWVGLGAESNNINYNCKHFDISSSYPTSMKQYGVPRGTPYYTMSEVEGKPAIYKCRVNVPRGTIPVVPLRTKSGVGWLYGSFETYLTSIDIQNARTRNCTVDVIDGYVFEEIIFPFNDFVDQCRELRILNKGEALEDVAKLMQNSVYGKFAMSREGKSIWISNEVDDKPRMLHGGLMDHYRHETDEERDAMYILPHWAAFITAGARINLHNFIDASGWENFLYADTDSAIITEEGYTRVANTNFFMTQEGRDEITKKYGQNKQGKNLGDIFTEYGKWALDAEYHAVRILAPKVYAALTTDFKVKGRAKGIPRRHATNSVFIDLLKNEKDRESFFYDSVSSFSAILKGGERVVKRNRKLSSISNSNNWVIRDGKVSAKDI